MTRIVYWSHLERLPAAVLQPMLLTRTQISLQQSLALLRIAKGRGRRKKLTIQASVTCWHHLIESLWSRFTKIKAARTMNNHSTVPLNGKWSSGKYLHVVLPMSHSFYQRAQELDSSGSIPSSQPASSEGSFVTPTLKRRKRKRSFVMRGSHSTPCDHSSSSSSSRTSSNDGMTIHRNATCLYPTEC